jgi:transglutaminase-like putative cysteine protease
MRMPAIGLQLEMLACDRACALAPVQPTDVLAQTLVKSPRELGKRELRRGLSYRLRLSQGDSAALDAVPGQSLTATASPGEFTLNIDPTGNADMPPGPEDLASTRWLQADDAELVALAQQATRTADDDAGRVAQLERFVRGYITTKSLRVGYASATEIMQQREGDCTEHAVLLAAMIRALNIPARVANGLAYTGHYSGHRNVFVPHAWVQAWVDGKWQGLDAALERFDAGHIAFNVGDGDPFRFYRGLDLLGAIEVLEADRLSAGQRRGNGS